MKKLNKKMARDFMFSLFILGLFFIMAIGSIQSEHMWEKKYEFTNDGKVRITYYSTLTFMVVHAQKMKTETVDVGGADSHGAYNGNVITEWYDKDGKVAYTEEVTLVYGSRQGTAKYTYADGRVEYKHYKDNTETSWENPPKEKAINETDRISGFDVLKGKYPWFLYMLNIGFEDDHVASFTERIEKELLEYDFDPDDFDYYYDQVLELIKEDPGEMEEILKIQNSLAIIEGYEKLKMTGFRKAIVDRYRSSGLTTYGIVKSEYPSFLESVLSYHEIEASEKGLELFCNDLDLRMDSYGELDTGDNHFLDTLDIWMYRAMYSLLSEYMGKSSMFNAAYAQALLKPLKPATLQRITVELSKVLPSGDEAKNAALVVANLMGEEYRKGDMIRICLEEAYKSGAGAAVLATLSTEFAGHLSPASVLINGNILEDGGAPVTARGIVWSTGNNPGMYDEIYYEGSGTGEFTVAITGLTPGIRYYARAFAKNLAGTAYGNVVTFLAGQDNGTETGSEPLIAHSYFPWLTSSKYVLFRQHPEGGYLAAGYGTTNVSDIFIARYSDKGDTLWTRRHAPPEGTTARWPLTGDMADGGFYLLTINLKPQIQWNEVMFFSLNGDSVWSTPVSEIQQWSGLPFAAIRTTPNGGCVVAGGSNGFPSAATIKKLSNAGAIEWVASGFTGDQGYNWFYDVDVNADGEVFATGRVHNNANGRQSFIVAKVSATGTKLWDKVHYSGLATAGDSIVGAGQTVVAAGDGGCIAGGYATYPGKTGRVVMKRLDSAGNIVWDNKYHRFAEDGGWQNAQVYDILPHTGGNYLALIHQFDGSSDANPTLMKFTPQGDTLWTQYGMDRRWRISGTDNRNNILICGNLPLAQAGWWEHATVVRATSGGIIYSPACTMPYDHSVNIINTPTLTWTVPYHLGTFSLELAADSTFTDVVFYESGIQGTTLTTPELSSFTTYYWRVNVSGAEGGPSDWSKFFRFTVRDYTATMENKFQSALSIYPNPACELAKIEFYTEEAGDISLSIINFSGQILFHTQLEGLPPGGHQHTIPLIGFDNGIYLCRVSNGVESATKKLIILRH